MKIARIILGVIMFMVAGYCLAFPIATELVYAYMISIFAGIFGIFALVDYSKKRKENKTSGVEGTIGGVVVGASVISIVIMLLNIFIPGFLVVTELISALFFLSLMLVEGIMSIVSAFTYRELNGGLKVLNVILGVLTVLAAIAGFWFPAIVIEMFGIFIAIGLMVSGIEMIISSFEQNK